MTKMPKGRWFFVLLVIVQTLIFGLGSAITKVAYESITPFWSMAFRFGFATIVFALLFGRRIASQLRSARLGDWLPAAVCMALSFISVNVALDLTTATNVGFLCALPVVFTPIIATIVHRRRYPVAFLPVQAVVVAGLYLLCCNGGALTFGPGEVLALVGAATLAAALVFGERGLGRLDAVSVAGTQIAASFVLSLAFALIAEPPVNIAEVTPAAWAVVAFLAVLSTCLTFLLQNVALMGLKPQTVSLLLTGEPVFTALFSFVILGETLQAMGLVGAAVIVCAVVVATLLEGRSDGAAECPEDAEGGEGAEHRGHGLPLVPGVDSACAQSVVSSSLKA